MPQLFPMNWNLLLLFFSLILITLSSLIYFNYKSSILMKFLKTSPLTKIWKW
uniref:ATP synthase F0 subunit 8 n=1 Tax=Alectorobius guaporensis TaxID=1783522 RepID=UPI00223908D5|nr:ATP synthase F0 subunit 8 [Alectorobius guaporensis]UYB78343.1 ATP synthase F0 subunit 8 [Alectorobius guaporensis]UYB78356.1 ATP synthase F0 subunit 8 [Alectorobius guaporensis]